MRLPGVAILASVTATACSLPAWPPGGTDGGVSITTSVQFCQEYSSRECKNVATACNFPEGDCLSSRAAACTTWAEQSETAGRVFVPANAGPCLNRVEQVFDVLKNSLAIDASDYRSIGTACKRVFQGSAGANEPCTVDEDCEDSLICDKGLCGTAQMVRAESACANIGEYCPGGYFCSGGSGNEIWLCTVRNSANSACDGTAPCMETLRCASGVCTARLAIGLSCEMDSDCSSGFCEPFAQKCGTDVRFADGTPACQAYEGNAPTSGGVDAGN